MKGGKPQVTRPRSGSDAQTTITGAGISNFLIPVAAKANITLLAGGLVFGWSVPPLPPLVDDFALGGTVRGQEGSSASKDPPWEENLAVPLESSTLDHWIVSGISDYCT